jgi:hypothetical protein
LIWLIKQCKIVLNIFSGTVSETSGHEFLETTKSDKKKFPPIGQSLLKLNESQRKRLESLFNTAYRVVKAGKPFSDYELICEIQVKNGLKLFSYWKTLMWTYFCFIDIWTMTKNDVNISKPFCCY